MITVKEMIANDDFTQITQDFEITFIDFSCLTDCKIDKDYSLYHISKEGVRARDVGDLSSCTVDEAVNIYSFSEAAKLDFPTTAFALVKWVENQNLEFSLPYTFKQVVAASMQTSEESAYPPPRQRHQEQEILRVISQLGYKAKALPTNKSGHSGVKAEVRMKLDLTTNVFDKAWDRLRSSKDIQNQ